MSDCERNYCGHPAESHSRGKCDRCPCPVLVGDRQWDALYLNEPYRSEGRPAPLPHEEKMALHAEIGQKLKKSALAAHEANHSSDLAAARLIRDRIFLERGEVTADDVREVFEKHRGADSWGSWAGSLFRDGGYKQTGEFRPSRFATRHGAVIRVWKR